MGAALAFRRKGQHPGTVSSFLDVMPQAVELVELARVHVERTGELRALGVGQQRGGDLRPGPCSLDAGVFAEPVLQLVQIAGFLAGLDQGSEHAR